MQKNSYNQTKLGHPFYGVILVALVVFSMPRVAHPVLPYGIGGVDLMLIVLFVGLLVHVLRVGKLTMPKGKLLLILFIPLFMAIMAFASLAVLGDVGIATEAFMQALRRLTPSALVLCLVQGYFRESETKRLLSVFVVSLIIGAGLFYLVELYKPLGLTNPSRLMGNFAALGVEDSSNEEGETTGPLTVRLAGNAGSQTIYGVLCGLGIIVSLEMFRKDGRGMFLVFFAVLWLGLIASSAKAAIVATALMQLPLFMQNRKMIAVTAMIVFLGLGIGAPYISEILGEIGRRGDSSWSSRLEKYEAAFDVIAANQMFILLGHGFKGLGTGWHSEFVETVMGYGCVLGGGVLVVLFLYLPLKMISNSCDKALISKWGMIGLWGIMIISAIFQDVVQDANILIFIVLVIGAQERTRSAFVDARIESLVHLRDSV